MQVIAVLLLFAVLGHGAAVPWPDPQISQEQIQKATQIKDRHVQSLMRLPAVTAVGVGASSTQRDRVAIVVYVGRKLKAGERRRFPKQFEGVPVEIREGGPFLAKPESRKKYH